MKLYLVRHGETVDNVAGLYAGVRDSALTIHGVEQARRLGGHLSKTGLDHTHIFSSPLSRALKTAQAVQRAQNDRKFDDNIKSNGIEIVQVPDLIEQDFGFYEGKSFFARSEARKSGRESHHDIHKDDPGFVDVESKESMAKRADSFLDEHLLPVLQDRSRDQELSIVVVSHGMLLSHLWRRLLIRLPRKSLTIAPEVTAAKGNVVLEHLGGWSNTGYLELLMIRDDTAGVAKLQADTASLKKAAKVPLPDSAVEDAPTTPDTGAPTQKFATTGVQTLSGWSMTIVAVDSKQHLVGLKRQRGGIGRLAHDEGQKKLDGFFKRQKTS